MILAITAAILLAYGAALWWLLREESPRVIGAVALVFALALVLRLIYPGDFPAGLNEDEPKILGCSAVLLARGEIWREGCTGLPVLLNALFQAQLIPLLGPGFWAIRLYSMLTGALSAVAAFAAARAMRLSLVPSLVAAALVAVLPWSLFYGRISFGGELVLHELAATTCFGRKSRRCSIRLSPLPAQTVRRSRTMSGTGTGWGYRPICGCGSPGAAGRRLGRHGCRGRAIPPTFASTCRRGMSSRHR